MCGAADTFLFAVSMLENSKKRTSVKTPCAPHIFRTIQIWLVPMLYESIPNNHFQYQSKRGCKWLGFIRVKSKLR